MIKIKFKKDNNYWKGGSICHKDFMFQIIRNEDTLFMVRFGVAAIGIGFLNYCCYIPLKYRMKVKGKTRWIYWYKKQSIFTIINHN